MQQIYCITSRHDSLCFELKYVIFAECPSKCHDCDVNEASNDATTCKNGECQAWDSSASSPRAYFKDSEGNCIGMLSISY